jgi:amino-acid N-acetyltransferase
MRVRSARPADIASVRALLKACHLPLDGVPEDLEVLHVATLEERVVGSVGLERHGPYALLRSLAVDPDCRGERIASALCDVAERRADEGAFQRVFLLTETAERFFARRGYEVLERSQAPAEIAASREFAAVCPASARLMARDRSR